MDSIIDCSSTNFANEAAFTEWKTKTSVDLSWNYFKDIWKKLYLNKDKGGDLWDLAVNGELTKNQIKVGKIRSRRNNQNNNQANDQPPPNEIIMPNDPHQLFHLLYVKYKKDEKIEDDMNVKDFIIQWRYKLSQINLDGDVQENYADINYPGALDHLNALSEETKYFFYENRPGSNSCTNVKCAREENGPWKLVGIVPGEDFQNYQDQSVEITDDEWVEYKESHENDHQQDIEGNNNDNDESTITDSPEVQENATTHDQQEEQGNTVEDLSTNDESTDDSSDDDDEEIESPVTVNENELIGSYAMEVEEQKENFESVSVTNTPQRVINNDSSQTPGTVAWNGTPNPNHNHNDYPYNTLFRNNPSYNTKNGTPLLSSRGVNLFGKHPRDEYNDDNDNERVKRQKVQKENEELTARVKELENDKDGMKVEHTEALATKQSKIDRLTTLRFAVNINSSIFVSSL